LIDNNAMKHGVDSIRYNFKCHAAVMHESVI